MSLLVWLPLQGDFHNQGLSSPIHSTALTSGNSWNTDTKIGGGSLKMTQSQTIFPTNSIMSGAKQFTACYWIKVNEAWTKDWLDGFRWISTNGESTATGRQEFYTNCTKIGVWYSGGSNSNKTCYIGTWMHLAFSVDYDAGICKFYRNGTLIGTTTNVNKAHYCRGDFYIGDSGINISMNDLRLYNHILSAEEVREIANGLILHYKLDNNECRNLLPGTTSQTHFTSSVSWTNKVWSLQSGGNGIARVVNDRNDLPISEITQYWTIDNNTSGNRDHGMSIFPQPTATGQAYTISLYARGTGTLQFRIWCNGTSAKTKTWTLTEDWTYYSWSYTSTANMVSHSSVALVGIKGAGSVDMCAIQLEHGTVATSWSPNIRDFYSTSYVTDNSGYGHHGNISDLQTFEYDISSVKYNLSTYIIDGATNYITTPSIDFPTDAITMNIWFKSTNTAPPANYHMLVDSVSNRVNYEMAIYKNGYFRAGLSINGTRQAGNCSSTTCLNGEWHMLTLTYDGATVKRYTDAILESSTAATGTLVANDILRIGKDGSGDYACVDSYLSDFRIYCTALLDTEIKKLYNISMGIDKQGQLHCGQINEDNKISIAKTTSIYGNLIEIPHLLYDEKVYQEPDGSLWIHMYHHNAPATYGVFTHNDDSQVSNEEFEKSIYLDEHRWFNVGICNYVDKWEIITVRRAQDTGNFVVNRWIQPANPMTTSSTAVANSTLTVISGSTYMRDEGTYSVGYKYYGYAHLNGSNASYTQAYICAGSSSNTWYGAIGAKQYWSGTDGTTSFNGTSKTSAITTGSVDLYLRIDNVQFLEHNNLSLSKNNKAWLTTQVIER